MEAVVVARRQVDHAVVQAILGVVQQAILVGGGERVPDGLLLLLRVCCSGHLFRGSRGGELVAAAGRGRRCGRRVAGGRGRWRERCGRRRAGDIDTLGPRLLAEEGVQSVVDALDLLEHAALDLAEVQYLAVARTDQTTGLVDGARVGLEAASKELGQVLELGEVVDVALGQIAAEHPRVQVVARLAAPHRQIDRVYLA